MSQDYFLINTETGLVENQILLEQDADWAVPEGFQLKLVEPSSRTEWVWAGTDWVVQAVTGRFGMIGDVWDGTKFVAPASPKPPMPAPAVEGGVETI